MPGNQSLLLGAPEKVGLDGKLLGPGIDQPLRLPSPPVMQPRLEALSR